MNHKYIIDANVLSMGAVRQSIGTDFFEKNCVVLEEITHELLDTSVYEEIKQYTVPMDGNILKYLHVVNEMISVGLVRTDEGNGEVLLIAWGLMMLEGTGNQATLSFMKDHPVIVTNETKVLRFAKSKGIDSISGSDFVEILNQISG